MAATYSGAQPQSRETSRWSSLSRSLLPPGDASGGGVDPLRYNGDAARRFQRIFSSHRLVATPGSARPKRPARSGVVLCT